MVKTAHRRPLSLATRHEPAPGAGLSPAADLRVARARRLLDAGFYDQPDVLEAALDRLLKRAERVRPAPASRRTA